MKVLIGYTMPNINSIGFTISGGAIAFLLVFRSVLSYNRFWEGRGHLGYIMAHARDLARQVAFSFKDDDGDPNIFRNVKTFEREMHENRTRPDYGTYHDQEGVREALIGMYGFRRMRMMRCCVMFWRLLIQHLRDEVSPTKVNELYVSFADASKPPVECVGFAQTLTTPHEEHFLAEKKRRPLVLINIMSWHLKEEYKAKNISYMEYQQMNLNMTGLIMGFNGADKVHSVPIPFPYAQMIIVLLSLYCFASPFLLVQYFGWWTCVPCCVLTTAFFGINEVALEIEDPFGSDDNDLPLDQMGDALKDDWAMNLIVAQVPEENIAMYWKELARAKPTWKKKHARLNEYDIAAGKSATKPKGLVGTAMKKNA